MRSSETLLTNLDGEIGETFDLYGAAVASDGSLVFMGTRDALGFTVVRGHRVDLSSGVWHATTLSSNVSSSPTSITSLPDGRLVVAAGVYDFTNSLAYARRTVVFSTTNGSAWSASAPGRISVQEQPGRILSNGAGGVTLVVTGTDTLSSGSPSIPYVLQTVVP